MASKTPAFKPVGCFRDHGRRPRPLPKLVANLRQDIVWTDLNRTIIECGCIVNEIGFHYFGVQFYGECWSGKDAEVNFNKQGKSGRCIYGVGKGHADFVHALVEKGDNFFIF